MRIAVVGLGYIGLPTALLLAKGGHDVFGFDVDAKKIELLKNGKLPFVEDGMEALFAEARAHFSADGVLYEAEVYVIAVPTPVYADHTCDLSYVEKAVSSVANKIKKNDLVILESTVSPGTTETKIRHILEAGGLKAGSDFCLGYVSEKAIPGHTLHEMIHNDRIVGGIDAESRYRVAGVYRTFVQGDIHETDCKTAETVKLVENAYRDVNIAFANEVAMICAKYGMNAWDVIRFANKHPRVRVHAPGPGVGGHCIAIDPWFLVEHDGAPGELIRAARGLNDGMPERVAMAASAIAKKHDTRTIGILGVAYKKNVDDSRETPALHIIETLEGRGFRVLVHDPLVQSFRHPLSPLETLLKDADGVILVTDHDAYQNTAFPASVKWLLDTRGLFSGKTFPFEYILLGTPSFHAYEE